LNTASPIESDVDFFLLHFSREKKKEKKNLKKGKMAGFDSPISTLLGGSPPSSLSLGKRAGDVRGMSLSSLCSALEDGEEESNSSSSDKESIRESPERESYSSSLLEIGIKTSTTSASTSTSSSTALLAARRARVLGANVATVDASLPPIVAGSGCRLFAEEEEEEAEAEASAASAGGADGESENPTLTKEKIEKKKKTKLVPFLDAQNNVAHLGHSHPAVAAALSTAFQTLNTNSRYLHPALVEHAEQLVELLSSSSPSSSSPSTSSSSSPPPPSRNGVEDPVVYYVPSGTEDREGVPRGGRRGGEKQEEGEGFDVVAVAVVVIFFSVSFFSVSFSDSPPPLPRPGGGLPRPRRGTREGLVVRLLRGESRQPLPRRRELAAAARLRPRQKQ
jgi:hypothetical protein